MEEAGQYEIEQKQQDQAQQEGISSSSEQLWPKQIFEKDNYRANVREATKSLDYPNSLLLWKQLSFKQVSKIGDVDKMTWKQHIAYLSFYTEQLERFLNTCHVSTPTS